MPYVNVVVGQRSPEFKAGNALHEDALFDGAMRMQKPNGFYPQDGLPVTFTFLACGIVALRSI